MKIQNMAIIFIIIILPIILVLSAYINTQIDTLNLQTSYDTILNDATYDGVKAFEINTSNNEYSTVADSLKRDVSAAINTYIKSMANNLGVAGYEQEHLLPYIPAIVFTLYDGYYIYSPTNVDGKIEYVLKPYIYYASRYTQGDNIDVVVNYTLDNHITVYGTIKEGKEIKYVNENGYLVTNLEVSPNPINMTEEDMIRGVNNKTFTVKYRGIEIDKEDLVAMEYFVFSYKFTSWVNNNLGTIEEKNALDIGGEEYENLLYAENQAGKVTGTKIFANRNNKIFKIDSSNDPEIESSPFFQHKREIIKYSIQDNLNMSISLYAKGNTTNFRMPVLTEEEWDDVTNNICMITFFQGVPIGNKTYNNYSIVASDKNKEFAKIENLYYMDGNNDGESKYHKIDCPRLTIWNGNAVSGYRNVKFDMTVKRDDKGVITSIGGMRRIACYDCIVNSNYDTTGIITLNKLKENQLGSLDAQNTKRAEECYATLARERWKKKTVTEYVEQEPDELWLYDEGDEFTETTGGWQSTIFSDWAHKNDSYKGAEYRKEGNALYMADISEDYWASGAFTTKNKIDKIANYKTLHLSFNVSKAKNVDHGFYVALTPKRPLIVEYVDSNRLTYKITYENNSTEFKNNYEMGVLFGTHITIVNKSGTFMNAHLWRNSDSLGEFNDVQIPLTNNIINSIKANQGAYVLVYTYAHDGIPAMIEVRLKQMWCTKD